MPFKDPDKSKSYHADYNRRWDANNKERRLEIGRARDEKRNGTPKRVKQKADVRARRHIRERVKVIEMYGGKCEFCTCDQYEFLTLDHIQGDGKQHRSEISSKYRTVYDYLVREGVVDRDKYRLLCWNCHMAWTRYGVAPEGEELHDITWWREKGALRNRKG